MNLSINSKAIAVILLLSTCIAHSRFYPNRLLETLFDNNNQIIDAKDKKLAEHFEQLPKETQEEIRCTFETKKKITADNSTWYRIGMASGCSCGLITFLAAELMQFSKSSKTAAALGAIVVTAAATTVTITTETMATSIIAKYNGVYIPEKEEK